MIIDCTSGESRPHLPEEIEASAVSLALVLQSIDAERDRRISGGFTFRGHRFQSRQTDRENIMGSALGAQMAIASGAQPGDLRWSDPEKDFVWIIEDNSKVPMDAFDVLALYHFGVAYKWSLTSFARDLKDAAGQSEDLAAFDWLSGWPEGRP